MLEMNKYNLRKYIRCLLDYHNILDKCFFETIYVDIINILDDGRKLLIRECHLCTI